MALSMDEQRMLAEIERRLVAEDPRLAARLSSFRRPSPLITLRTTRGRIIGSLITVGLVTVISVIVYVMVPFRAHIPKSTTSPRASTSAVVTGSPRFGPAVNTAKPSTTAGEATSPSASAGTSGIPAGSTKTGTRTSPAASQPAPVNAS